MKTFYIILITLASFLQTFSQVHVKGYYRKNGTYVSPHQRTRPNKSIYDNYSYKGNVNPHTGEVGTKLYGQSSNYSTSLVISSYSDKKYYRTVYSKKVKTLKNSYFHTSIDNKPQIVSISSNKEIEIIGITNNNFYRIKYGDIEGFLDQKFISELDRISTNGIDSTLVNYPPPPVNIDTLKGLPAKVVAEKAFLREYSESNQTNIIKTLPYGSKITVLYADINGYWVVKHEDNIGVMLDVFFTYTKKLEKKDTKKKFRFFNLINKRLLLK